jgi:ribosomal protein S18 acetylase RimI-like enzyme
VEFSIERADNADAEAILTLQKLAYQSEATLYNDFALPPLIESKQDLIREFRTHIFLVARSGRRIIGSVRATTKDGRCHIRRLMVHPNHQRKGLGTRLMTAIEAAFPESRAFELFTGHMSDGNLRLYRRLGYTEFKHKPFASGPPVVFLEKPNPSRPSRV